MPSRITDEQRRAWIAAAVEASPPLSEDFVRYLDAKPSTIITQSIREFVEVCRRDSAGQLNIARMEDGQFSRDDGLPRAGYTFSVYYKQPEQTNLI